MKTQPKVEEIKNKPEMTFRAGGVKATIWNNSAMKDGKKIEYKTVSFDRSYKDKEDAWKTTNSLRSNDIPKAVLVLSKAFEYIALKEEDDDIY